MVHKVSVKDFPSLDLGDARRNERFVTIINNIIGQPGSSIPKQSGRWYDAKATYEFFKNERVSVENLQSTLQSYGASQVGEFGEVLIVHDTSNISFADLQAEGLGYLDSKEGRGILCHSSIAVSTGGLPLSLVRQYTWIRELENLQAVKKQAKSFEQRESYRWYAGIAQANQLLGAVVQKIHIADREADIYELFFCAHEPNTELLIRVHYNRKVAGADGSLLWDTVAASEKKGEVTLHLADEKGSRTKSVKVEVRYEPVEILRPLTSKAAYQSVALTAIEVKQATGERNGEEPIHWKLLTTLNVKDLKDVLTYVRWYTYRWLIERFHYVLKSGIRIEALQLKKASSLQKAIALYSIAGFKIMQLVYESRSHPDASCEVALTQAQWQVLHLLIHPSDDMPEQPPTLSQAVKWMARLGGHLGRKTDGPPGVKTTWLGYQRVVDAANVYEQLQKNLGKG